MWLGLCEHLPLHLRNYVMTTKFLQDAFFVARNLLSVSKTGVIDPQVLGILQQYQSENAAYFQTKFQIQVELTECRYT